VRRAAWIDAARGEVYGRLYMPAGAAWEAVTAPVVGRPSAVLEAWSDELGPGPIEFVGDGATAYLEQIAEVLGGRARPADGVPPLAAAIANIAAREDKAGLAVAPDAIRPLYVRRPDVELARERRGQGPR
jgi:tRNA A37 threonylcarbamoyladenosine modification protein TsaB